MNNKQLNRFRIKRLFYLLSFVPSALLGQQTPTKSFDQKLEGIQSSKKELTKSAVTDNTSIGQSGVMSTTVPLVTVQSRTMTFPLELHYSSGIKTDQKSGPVGLGWVLPIGSIVRDYGAYEPDYSSTYHEADMYNQVDVNTNSTSNKGRFSAGSQVNPMANSQYLGYDAIESVGNRPMPLSDKYHVSVPGALNNTFWNRAPIYSPHLWTLEEAQRWGNTAYC